jgi:tetratricopeptide (TPR) repeat protein
MRTPSLSISLSLALLGCPASQQQERTPAAEASPPSSKSPSDKNENAASAPQTPEAREKPKKKTKAQRDEERRTFEAELRILDREREGFEKLLAKTPTNRLNHERVASIFMQRARLSGSYEDYAKAEAAIERAFDPTPGGTTYMVRAKLHYTLHRLPEARVDFEAAKPLTMKSPDAVASIEAFEANLALQAGDDAKASTHFDASLEAKRTTANLSSVAVYHWKTGDFEKAEELFREALKGYHAKAMEPRAWIHLNLGLLDLDRGRYDDALAHYREAESFLKGYWLIDEHIAEILTLQGKVDEAKTLYLDIIGRTNNPEFMDAMAGIAFEAGEEDKGREWVAKARKRYEEQMEKYPEAAYGHALGHYIEFGEDPAFVLELAQKNYDLRPNLEAAIMLAQAHLKAGDAKAAERALGKTLKSKFKSAELYAVAAEIQQSLGREKKAKGLIAQAQAIDPTAALGTSDAEQ